MINKSLIKRLEVLENKIKPLSFTVYYKSGKTRQIKPADAIALSLYEGELIDRFEENEPCINCGCLQDLCNALLIIPEDEGGENDERKINI